MACFPVYKGIKYNSIEELREKNKPKIDSELLKIIGYRIPNQKLSSNQPLEVVGILPPSMGDSIMMYTEITTQTGSDFDIDKTYVMLPAFEVEYSNKKDLVDTLFKMDDSELLGFREDIEDYQNYIAENPLPADKINNPGANKKQLINYLIDRGLVPADLSKKYVKGLRYVKPVKQKVQTETSKVDLKSFINYSGAASGADTIWENTGKEFGLGKQVNYKPESLKKLTKEELKEIEDAYQQAVKDLGRKPLDADTFAGGLVRRDYLQAKAADSVFAISTIVEPGEKDPKGYINKTNKPLVAGGTGYAVQMAINLGKPVYVFDQIKNKWFYWNNNNNFEEVSTPVLTEKFAGIGTREINDNGKKAIKNVYEKTTQSSNSSKSNLINPNKKQLQNELFEIYYDVLSSPLSYVDMMSSIDGSSLKDEIDRLHGKREDLTNLQLIDPTYQLRIKFDNIVGKSGVGLTANQMVDHVYGQISGLTMNDPASLAHIRKYVKVRQDGTIDLSQIFDTEGNKITDSISMFLNAYVDIAKDPYVTKGNFNSYTSNITFFLLRAGMPLKHVISFVGQPILKQLVAEYESTLSSLPSTANKRQTLKESIDNVKRKLNERIDKATLQLSNFAGTENIGNQLTTTDTVAGSMKSKSVLDTALLNSSTYEKLLDFLNGDSQLVADRYNANPDGFMQEVKDLQSYLQTQFTSLNNFEILNDSGEQLSEQVLISKADVNGGGHDIATHFTNNNRYNKVINAGVFSGLGNKFDPSTMLGAKTLYTMKFFNSLDENLFITMHPLIKPIYPMITKILKGDDYATNAEVVKRVESSLYASMVQLGLRNTPYETTRQDIADLLKEDTGIIARINSAKLNDKYADNALIKALEVVKEDEYGNEGNLIESKLFLSVDNFTRKPETVVDDLSDAWQELLDSNDELDRNLAKDLIKYAIFTSGLSKNRHSIFEFMPIEVADYINRGITKLKDTGIDSVFNVFIEDFIRHNQNEDFRIKADIKTLAAGVKGVKASDLGLQNIDSRVKLIRKDFSKAEIAKVARTNIEASEATKFKIQSYKLFKDGGQLMSYIGDIKSLDGTGDIMVIVPTYTLGKKVGNGNIYEYTSTNNTVFKDNQPKDIQSIVDSVKTIKNTFDFAPHSFDLSKTLLHYGKNIQVTEYDPAKAREELIKRNLIKENKC
jgi:hypothetical protein